MKSLGKQPKKSPARVLRALYRSITTPMKLYFSVREPNEDGDPFREFTHLVYADDRNHCPFEGIGANPEEAKESLLTAIDSEIASLHRLKVEVAELVPRRKGK